MGKTNSGKEGGMLKGPSHDNGGIPVVVTGDNNRPVEVEGGEVIINKKSIADNTVYVVKGTPRQIASAINTINGNGRVIENGGQITNTTTGKTQIMKDGGLVEKKDMLWFLKWWE